MRKKKTASKTVPSYKLKTLADVQDVVSEENFGAFIKDFTLWLGFGLAVKKHGRGLIKPAEPGIFNWIDDGENKVSINIKTPKK